MGIVWQKSLSSKLVDPGQPTDLIYKLRTSRIYLAMHAALKKYIAPALFAFTFVYLGLTLTSHVLFNIQDDAGWVCREKAVAYGPNPQYPGHQKVIDYNGLKKLQPGETILASGDITGNNPIDKERLPEFKTSALCQSMGIWVERYEKYLIKFDTTQNFKDENGAVEAWAGFYSTEPPSYLQKAKKIAQVPLRRELIRPWFRVVVRIGGKGGEESFLDPDFKDDFLIDEEIKATRDGELFLFVNDAVIGIPGFDGYFYKYFYSDNQGSTKVWITRIK